MHSWDRTGSGGREWTSNSFDHFLNCKSLDRFFSSNSLDRFFSSNSFARCFSCKSFVSCNSFAWFFSWTAASSAVTDLIASSAVQLGGCPLKRSYQYWKVQFSFVVGTKVQACFWIAKRTEIKYPGSRSSVLIVVVCLAPVHNCAMQNVSANVWFLSILLKLPNSSWCCLITKLKMLVVAPRPTHDLLFLTVFANVLSSILF